MNLSVRRPNFNDYYTSTLPRIQTRGSPIFTRNNGRTLRGRFPHSSVANDLHEVRPGNEQPLDGSQIDTWVWSLRVGYSLFSGIEKVQRERICA